MHPGYVPGQVQPGGDPGADPAHAGEVMFLSWPGNALEDVAGEKVV